MLFLILDASIKINGPYIQVFDFPPVLGVFDLSSHILRMLYHKKLQFQMYLKNGYTILY